MNNKYDQIHVITSLSKGGAENMLYKIFKFWKTKSILIICLSEKNFYSNKFKNENIEVIHLNLNGKNFILKLFILIGILKFKSKSIIGWMYHGNFVATILYLYRIALFNNVNLIWNIRQTLYDIKYEKKSTYFIIKLNKLLSSFPKKIIYNSRLSIKHHKEEGFNKKNSIFIPNGFELEYVTDYHNTNLKENLNISKNDIVISHINRFHPMKNHKLALEVADEVLSKYKNIKFIFCGKDINLNNEEFLKLVKLDEKKLKKCFFLDDIDNVNELLSFTNLFLLTSSWGEGFPNIIGEAMFNECNIISTKVGDVENILDKNSIIVPINSKKDILNNIDLLLSTKKIFKKNSHAREIIKQNFSIHNIIKKFNKEF